MASPYLTGVLVASTFGALLAPPARAQCAKTFGPMQLDQRPCETLAGDQRACQVVRVATGFVAAWTSGGDVYLRRFEGHLIPLGPEILVNATMGAGVQDEPAISRGTTGNVLVLWTDRSGYDGSGSSVMAKLYDPNGVALSGEFVVNETTNGPQYGAQAAPTLSGGWAVAWTGDADENVDLRILNSDGSFHTSEIPVNTYRAGSQRDAAVGVNSQGTILVAFVDGSGNGNAGTGTNLWGRTFDSEGVALEAREHTLNTTPRDGDQVRPRIATDGLARFVLVWQDELGDASGGGIFERVFDRNGDPLAAEALVNTTTFGDQVSPTIAVDSLGRQIIAWSDYSAGSPVPVIRARHMNAQGNPYDADFQVNENPPNGTITPTVCMDPSDLDILFGYEGPGVQGNGKDVYIRRFEWNSGPHVYCSAKANSQGCLPEINWSGTPSPTSTSPFTISATKLLNRRLVLLFYGYGSQFTPFQGSTICVAPPLKRLPAMNSGGNQGAIDCSGAPSTDFNARIRGGADPGLVPGAMVSARWYYRDSLDPAGFGTGLSDALRFAICP
jgi:hypothetical protein